MKTTFKFLGVLLLIITSSTSCSIDNINKQEPLQQKSLKQTDNTRGLIAASGRVSPYFEQANYCSYGHYYKAKAYANSGGVKSYARKVTTHTFPNGNQNQIPEVNTFTIPANSTVSSNEEYILIDPTSEYSNALMKVVEVRRISNNAVDNTDQKGTYSASVDVCYHDQVDDNGGLDDNDSNDDGATDGLGDPNIGNDDDIWN